MKKKEKVTFKTKDGMIENLWAEKVSEGIYKIDNSPFEIYNISWKDLVNTIKKKREKYIC